MIKSLTIKNFILIDELTLDLDKGFNVITGETGAGKSLIINAIDIAFGGKSNKDSIKTGANQALIEITLTNINNNSLEFLKENEIEIFDNEIIISKEITQTSSKTRINGVLVTQDFIKNLREKIIDIHSQHQTYSYIQPKYHIHLLDNFADDNYKNILNKYKNLYNKMLEIQKQLDTVKNASQLTEQQIDFLKFQIQEIEQAEIEDFEEDEKLDEELKILSNAETLKELTFSSYWALYGEDKNILEALTDIKINISKANELDNTLEDKLEQITDVIETIKDISGDLRNYSENVTSNQERIDEIQERIDVLEKIKRKYGKTLEEVYTCYEKFSQELSGIENSQNNIEELEQELDHITKQTNEKANELTTLRTKNAENLSQILTQELEKLDMPRVQFKIDIEECQLNENGKDKVEFLISTNISEAPKPLIKIASGGEISRVMLGIKTIFAKADFINTIIFDEIDTGISGKASQAVAEELKTLAASHQIISITHQPIIAAKATKHFYVAKDNNVETKICIYDLKDENKIKAIAILASGEINEESMNFARQLINS